MDAYRSYEADLVLGEDITSLWFEERAGTLIPSDGPKDAPWLAAWEFADEVTGAKVAVRTFGIAGEKRLAPASSDPAYRLARLFLSLADFKAGAMLRGLQRAHHFRYAAEAEILTARSVLKDDERRNLFLEALFSPWQALVPGDLPALSAVCGIDPQIGSADLDKLVRDSYATMKSWCTRVVGFRFAAEHFLHDELGVEKSKVKKGDACFLVRENHNHDDANAVMVLHQSSRKLGYLRRTIAAYLAPLMDHGALFSARVAVFLPDDIDLDERLCLTVERAG